MAGEAATGRSIQPKYDWGEDRASGLTNPKRRDGSRARDEQSGNKKPASRDAGSYCRNGRRI
jgi:hypothetical protein